MSHYTDFDSWDELEAHMREDEEYALKFNRQVSGFQGTLNIRKPTRLAQI